MRDLVTAVVALVVFIAVAVGIMMFFSNVNCSNKADMFGTQYKVIAGSECYLKLDNTWVTEKMYGLAKSFKD